MFRSVMFALVASVVVLSMGESKAQAGGTKIIIGIGGGYKPWPTYYPSYYPSYYPVYTDPVVIPVVAPTYALWYKTSPTDAWRVYSMYSSYLLAKEAADILGTRGYEVQISR